LTILGALVATEGHTGVYLADEYFTTIKELHAKVELILEGTK